MRKRVRQIFPMRMALMMVEAELQSDAIFPVTKR
jgi:hypothetical protein